jgi:branched-chain amino acid transport system substrate-binding protein
MYEPFHHLKFGLLSSYYDQMRSAVKYFVEKRGKKQPCAAYQDTDFGRDVMNGVWDQTKQMGIKLVAETTHKPTDTDFSAAVAKLRDAQCDVVFFGTIVRDTNQLISAIRKTGWNVDMVGQVASYDTAIAELPGGAGEGFYTMSSFVLVAPDDPRPAVAAFVKKYHALYGKDPNPAAQIGYTGAELLIQGLRNGGKTLTADSFVAGMEKINGYHDIFGSPTVTFGPTKHQGASESFLLQVKGGRFVPVEAEPVGY